MIAACIIVFLAAAYNAIMDTCVHHFSRSIFNSDKFSETFWDGTISWMNKYVNGNPIRGRRKFTVWGMSFNIPVQFTDSWHYFKSLMIITMCMLGVLDSPWLEANPILGLIILGIVWNGTFGLFYNIILIKKEHRKKQ